MKRQLQLKVNIPELSYSWNEYASEYPAKSKPGITYRKSVEGKIGPEALLYYHTDGSLAGIFTYFPNDIPAPPELRPFAERAGNFNVIVDPNCRRLGIGMKLLREGVRRWPINFEQQNYTLEGAKLIQRFFLPPRTPTKKKVKRRK